jgi:hypothetical protein
MTQFMPPSELYTTNIIQFLNNPVKHVLPFNYISGENSWNLQDTGKNNASAANNFSFLLVFFRFAGYDMSVTGMSARAKPWRVLPLPHGKAAGTQKGKDERTGEAVARPAASAW